MSAMLPGAYSQSAVSFLFLQSSRMLFRWRICQLMYSKE